MNTIEIIVLAMFTVAAVVLAGINGLVVGGLALIVLAWMTIGGMPVTGVVGGISAALLTIVLIAKRCRRGSPIPRLAKGD